MEQETEVQQVRMLAEGILKPNVATDGVVTLMFDITQPSPLGIDVFTAKVPADRWWALSRQVGDMLRAAGFPPPEE